MKLNEILDTIETRLGIKGTLEIKNGTIIPCSTLSKKVISEMHIDDLFQKHSKQYVFTNRFMHLISEMFDRKVKTGHYKLTLE